MIATLTLEIRGQFWQGSVPHVAYGWMEYWANGLQTLQNVDAQVSSSLWLVEHHQQTGNDRLGLWQIH